MTRIGRQLSIGKTDNTSDQRTPRKRLRLIPTDVRESFVPVIPARAVQRQNEWDLTRIAPNRPRAEGSPIEVKGTVRNESGTLLRGALIEIWNANHYGRYRHVEDHSGLKLDENFVFYILFPTIHYIPLSSLGNQENGNINISGWGMMSFYKKK